MTPGLLFFPPSIGGIGDDRYNFENTGADSDSEKQLQEWRKGIDEVLQKSYQRCHIAGDCICGRFASQKYFYDASICLRAYNKIKFSINFLPLDGGG